MNSTYNVARAQAQLPRLLKEAQNTPIAITKHDETVAYLISKERMEAIAETLEILANPEAMEAINDDKADKTSFHGLDFLD